MSILWLSLWTYFGLVYSSCPGTSLVEYEINLETHWDRRDFPKHYPEWRPPASWSKLIGYSHNSSFLLFRKGKPASVPFQRFAETGNSENLDLQTQGSFGVHDAFMTVPIPTGVGKARVRFTTNGNHSKVSFASKITPSPDWFIGVDTYDLCPKGRWMEYVHIQGEPIDAGTDSGLTFTSPNWQTDPREPIREITNHIPQHPAGSFYYPQLHSLPALSEFTITKINEYTLDNKFDASDHSGIPYSNINLDLKYKNGEKKPAEVQNENHIRKNMVDKNKNQVTYSSSENDLPIEEKITFSRIENEFSPWESNEIVRNKLQERYKTKLEEPTITPSSTTTRMPITEDLTIAASPATNMSILNSLDRRPLRFRPRQRLRNVKHKKKIPTGDAMAVIDNIVRKYQKEHKRQLRKRRREGRKRRKNSTKKIRPPRDCRVSDWTEWTGCSKTCGIGEKIRSREMVQRARRGGKPCPALQETTWCGSARACQRHYFNWSF